MDAGLAGALHPTYLFVLALLAVAIFTDWRGRRLRWPFPFAFIWFALTYATLYPFAASDWFDGVARALAAGVSA